MLVISLFLSLILLLVANVAIRRSRRPLVPVLLATAALAIGPCLAFIVLPVLVWQALLLLIAVGVAQGSGWRPARFTQISCAVTLLAYGVAAGFAWHQASRLLELFPYASMEDRLPLSRVQPGGVLSAATSERLQDLQDQLDYEATRDWRSERRQRGLKKLHEAAPVAFMSQPGFGQTRMTPLLSERSLRGRSRGPTPAQSGSAIPIVWSTGDLEGPAPALPKADFTQSWKMHADGLVDFLNPNGFGYFKDRLHVAGFQDHRFSQVPAAGEPWKLQTLELLGLVVHDQPVVYVSDHLPSMEEVRNTAQRAPDSFEMVGLQALGQGEDLYVRDAPQGRRMLGAIRSVKQCLDCHGGERGDLVGAFSYTLSRVP
jgi:hypothetical protein